MRIVVRAVGRLRDKRLEAVCDEYLTRTRRHLPVDVVEVAHERDLAVRTVGHELVALHPEGESWSTSDFTKFIDDRMLHGRKAIVFLIGGADGLSTGTLARVDKRLSLSALTLPHRLARVILCEQVYRALSILRGEPYDR